MNKGLVICPILILMFACAPPSAGSTLAPFTAAPAAARTATVAKSSLQAADPTAKSLETYMPPSSEQCPVTPLVKASAPPDPNASPISDTWWYINADRAIWASGPSPSTNGPTEWVGKMYWVRPTGTQFTITGRRLDGNAPPLGVVMPCCYPTGFQIAALSFPTPGCWEVDAKAGASELRFVTFVKS